MQIALLTIGSLIIILLIIISLQVKDIKRLAMLLLENYFSDFEKSLPTQSPHIADIYQGGLTTLPPTSEKEAA